MKHHAPKQRMKNVKALRRAGSGGGGKPPVGGHKRPKRQAIPTAQFDLWGEAPAKPAPKKKQAAEKAAIAEEFRQESTIRGNPVQVKPWLKKRPMLLSKAVPSGRPAVELPHPGMSYNPDEEARQEASRSALKTLQRMLKEDRKWTRIINPNPEPLEPRREEEVFPDLVLSEEPVELRKQRKKTPQERNHKKRAMRKATRQEKKRREKRKMAQVDRIEIIAAKLAEAAAVRDALSDLQKELRTVHKPMNVRKLGGTKYVAKPVPVLISSDVQCNLRKQDMAVAGSDPLTDRYDSFLKRNILQPNRKIDPLPYMGPKRKPCYALRT